MAITIPNKIIEYAFYLLFFLTPLLLTPVNYELFEYNKMMFVYALTAVIVGTWVLKMISAKRFFFKRTPLDLPLALFFLSQLLSTIFSIDSHVSFWGYYSRFNGGFLSTSSYLLLYFALVSNLEKSKVLNSFRLGLLSGFLVAAYGVAEHFGIDAKYWVQDVRNRVFSTLGQPNWLAAYLSVLIPIALAQGLESFLSQKNQEHQVLGIKYPGSKRDLLLAACCLLLAALFYLTLLYTKSRSGFLGFWAGNLLFWAIVIFRFRKMLLKWFLILNFSFLILNFVVGAPFEQINRYSLPSLRDKINHSAPKPSSPPPPGGTESSEIRRIVWKGAVDVWRHYPLLGSGVETFAFSYYQYRPAAHNMVSEWDFLYNKAHNEYLNYLATTGIFGLGSYLLLIFWFLWWNIKNLKTQSVKRVLTFAFLASYISILVSNFFGFSVVIIALFFFLLPAAYFVLLDPEPNGQFDPQPPPIIVKNNKHHKSHQSEGESLNSLQTIFCGLTVILTLWILFNLGKLWLADFYFAKGYNLGRVEDWNASYDSLKQAISLNSDEPLYHDELSSTAANLALEAAQGKDSTSAAQLIRESLNENRLALEESPRNVSYWKTRTKIFYSLASFNEEYNQEALDAIKQAKELAPTDAKVVYNLAILYGRVGNEEMAVKTLKETVKLKPDYRDAYYALALYLKAEGKNEEAIQKLEFILKNIAPGDQQTKDTLKSWEGKL